MVEPAVELRKIEAECFNLRISRYVSIDEPEIQADLAATHAELAEVESEIRAAATRHNEFLKELGLDLLPEADGLI
jgi:type I restriction enzyme M protein